MGKANMFCVKAGSLIILSSMFSGCAAVVPAIWAGVPAAMNADTTDSSLVAKTAKHFGVAEKEINVSSVDKGILSTSYQVRHKSTVYNCRFYLGEVSCKQPGT